MAAIHVLISNDDGIDAFGLRALESALQELPGFRTTTVAPATQQSATSRCMTLSRPLRVRACGAGRWSVTGTPTDTVMVALGKILRDDPPDFVLAGINHGPNLGEDVHYSGTVAAAMEGCIQGLPAAAISLADWRPTDFGGAAAFMRRMLPDLVARPLPPGTMWNINVPNGPEASLRGVRVTRQGSRTYHDVINDLTDPRGIPLVWISGKGPAWAEDRDSDHAAVRDGLVSMTPLKIDLTDLDAWRRYAAELDATVPGAACYAEDGSRFVMRPDGAVGLTMEGPTRGGEDLRPKPACEDGTSGR
jgi:5'-nucleotidase